jgi:hypothetical protein
MMKHMKTLLLFASLLLAMGLLAVCGGSTKETSVAPSSGMGFERGEAIGAPDFPVASTVVVEREVIREVPKEVVKEVPAGEPALGSADAAEESFEGERAATQAIQERMIVRTVNMALVVAEVSASVDDISGVATSLGGWVVSAERSKVQSGFVAIRVPAERLDEAIQQLRHLADEVESEVTTSRDVTEEYVDYASRLKNLEATRDALVKLLEKAVRVEDALSVQQELTRVQGDIEVIQGRLKLLEETSAFSLVNIGLRTKPQEMAVDAGPDQTSGLGQVVRFRASFKPPESMEDFLYTWDFGDGTGTVTLDRTAPTADEETRVTATVTHFYGDEKDSPYIAEIKITGTDENGTVEGRDFVIVTVTKLPTIEVFAGDYQAVQEGEPVELAGTFTRPAELTDVSYTWDFGDGSAVVSGDLAEGATSAAASHTYQHHRPQPYQATLTIKGQSKAGPVEASASVGVAVEEAPGWTIAGWDAGSTGKSAVRALSGVGRVLADIGIWVGIFSPLWIGAGVLIWWWRRRRNAI